MIPTPETGLFGSGDYPEDFGTIDDYLRSDRALPPEERGGYFADRAWARGLIRNAILTIAEDLDARGLVLIDRIDLQRIDTADADLETGEGA